MQKITPEIEAELNRGLQELKEAKEKWREALEQVERIAIKQKEASDRRKP